MRAYLGVDKAAVLARVQVDQVQRVARELDALTLDDIRILAAYSHTISLHSHTQTFTHPIRIRRPQFPPPADSTSPSPRTLGQKHTSNLPDQVIADNRRVVCGRHGWRYFRNWRMKTRGFKIQDFKEDFLYRFALFRISILNLLCALPANRHHFSPLARYKREPESLRPRR